MSSVIHMHIEVKKGGRWHHYSAPSILRDPLFFDLAAGLSGKISPIVPLKNLPDDMSELTMECYLLDAKDHMRLHHHGWLSSEELHTLQKQLKILRLDAPILETDLEESYFHCYIRGNAVSSHKGFDDSRLVFWFDN